MLKSSIKLFQSGKNLNSLFRVNINTSSTAEEKWDLLTAVLLERKPVITPALNELEKEFKEYLGAVELERSIKNDTEIKLEKESKVLELTKDVDDVDLVLTQTTQDFVEACTDELNKFQTAERMTETDKRNDQASINRKLDKHLVFVKTQKIGNQKLYLFPQSKRQGNETLRQCAERIVQENFGKDVKVLLYGNAPCGFYKYRYPKKVVEACGEAVGAKVFFYFARYITGEKSKKDADCKWLDRDELLKILPHQYKDAVSQVLID